MKRVSDRFLQLAVIAAVIGMAWGITMGMRQDFVTSSAHAHLNLLGWVSMMVYGLFYRAFPEVAASRLTTFHFIVNVVGVLLFVPSLAFVLIDHSTPLAPVLIVASLLLFLSMLIFAVNVFKATGGRRMAAA
jgi:cbb3-type cytochrome oxidase subunit 1